MIKHDIFLCFFFKQKKHLFIFNINWWRDSFVHDVDYKSFFKVCCQWKQRAEEKLRDLIQRDLINVKTLHDDEDELYRVFTHATAFSLTIIIIYEEENIDMSMSIKDENILITLDDSLNWANEVKFIKRDASNCWELFVKSIDIQSF